jgi:nitrite reductase/ring-hydroxylating ferredoxin subunit
MALRKHYGEPAEAIRLADGRKLCPHRKADISSFPIDAEGMVICPLHGLKVRCGAVT